MMALFANLLQRVFGDRAFDMFFWWLFFRITPVPSDGDRIPILVFNHVFEQDLEALQRVNKRFSFIILSGFTLRNMATRIFPPTVESYHVYNSTELAPLRERWHQIMSRFVEHLVRRYHIQAVIAPSDSFFYVRELIPVLHQHQIPYYVVDKEGTICPAYFTHYAQYIHDHCPLLADHILVWSERQKQFWIKSGVEPNRITITGQPRSDFWRQPDRWLKKTDLGLPGLRQTAPFFLFFTYDPWAYTPDYMVAKGEMHWEVLRAETHATLFDFARRHPEIDLVLKIHPQQLDRREIQDEIDRASAANVSLATGSTISNQLIVNADCIIGFQTTALIEAMITDRPIIYTFWGEAKDRWANDLIPFHETAGVQTVTNPDSLLAALEAIRAMQPINATTRQARDKFVTEYFTSVDGQASSRTLAALAKLLRVHHE